MVSDNWSLVSEESGKCQRLFYIPVSGNRLWVVFILYDHSPETVTENEDTTILWNMQIHTDRRIPANKPDIVV